MAAANWLLNKYSPPRSSWLVSYSDEERAARLHMAHRIGKVFLKFGNRRPSTRRTRQTLFERRDAVWLDRIFETLVAGGMGKTYCMSGDTESGLLFAGPLEISAFRKCRDAARRKRGNNRLRPADLEARVSGRILVEGRHRKRLARQQRYDRAMADWIAKGGSLLYGPDMPVF